MKTFITALIVTFAFAAVATANPRTCTTHCFGNTCTTTCF